MLVLTFLSGLDSEIRACLSTAALKKKKLKLFKIIWLGIRRYRRQFSPRTVMILVSDSDCIYWEFSKNQGTNAVINKT